MADLWLTLIITCIVFGYAGYLFAKKTGRNTMQWALLGAGLNIVILAVILTTENRSKKVRRFNI